jgi:ABC-type transport system involved in cytochrome bd biosynthesis fused ATPase/permease subunit
LSGGEAARIALARALVRTAPLLIVDEPTAHLDEGTAARVRAALLDARRTSTILAISHDDELAALADHVVTLDAGRTVAPVVRRQAAERRASRVAWVNR